MTITLLSMKDVSVTVSGTKLISKVDLTINPGEIHVVMGPNGAGKSTLAKVLAGHPDFQLSSGEIVFLGTPLQDVAPEERSLMGLFLSFQNPIEIPGVSNRAFLKASLDAAMKAKGLLPLSSDEFVPILEKIMDEVQLKPEARTRDLNVGFSGGEKKRNEIAQMLLLEPRLAVLDEIDSGLDVDALKIVSSAMNSFMNKERGLLIITHYQRLLDYVKPDYVHVMMGGRIVCSGGFELALQLERAGYEGLELS